MSQPLDGVDLILAQELPVDQHRAAVGRAVLCLGRRLDRRDQHVRRAFAVGMGQELDAVGIGPVDRVRRLLHRGCGIAEVAGRIVPDGGVVGPVAQRREALRRAVDRQLRPADAEAVHVVARDVGDDVVAVAHHLHVRHDVDLEPALGRDLLHDLDLGRDRPALHRGGVAVARPEFGARLQRSPSSRSRSTMTGASPSTRVMRVLFQHAGRLARGIAHE